MTTFVLIHGAGGSGWDWGHETVVPDLPAEDDAAETKASDCGSER